MLVISAFSSYGERDNIAGFLDLNFKFYDLKLVMEHFPQIGGPEI